MLVHFQGHIGAALILGGVDNSGPHLYNIYPHGSSDNLPYCTMGSGSLGAMAVFESRWKPNMSVSVEMFYVSYNFLILVRLVSKLVAP